jgi:hypothetical protein
MSQINHDQNVPKTSFSYSTTNAASTTDATATALLSRQPPKQRCPDSRQANFIGAFMDALCERVLQDSRSCNDFVCLFQERSFKEQFKILVNH